MLGAGALVKRWLWQSALVCVLVVCHNGASASTSPRASAPQVSILTFGPGDAAFSKFGHNALRIRKPTGPYAERDRVYNFGTFRFDSPLLIGDFLGGRLRYWLSVDTFRETLRKYRALNRSVVEQELDLEPAAARALVAALEVNARPENREYLYDYYRDNCSTRVQDALDAALGGALRQRGQGETPRTYRFHTLRLTENDFALNLALDWILNDRTDRPLTVWEEGFLPERLQASLRTVPAPHAGAGALLVTAERTLHAVDRPPIASAPRDLRAQFGLVGVLVGAALGGLGLLGARGGCWVRGLASGLVAMTTIFGWLGVLLALMWMTNHEVAHANENLLQCAPWTIALPFLVSGVARRDPRACQRFERLLLAAAVVACAGLIAKCSPVFDQGGLRVALFLVPMWLGAACAAAFLRRDVRLPHPQAGYAATAETT